jgi:hypothetical protein
MSSAKSNKCVEVSHTYYNIPILYSSYSDEQLSHGEGSNYFDNQINHGLFKIYESAGISSFSIPYITSPQFITMSLLEAGYDSEAANLFWICSGLPNNLYQTSTALKTMLKYLDLLKADKPLCSIFFTKGFHETQQLGWVRFSRIYGNNNVTNSEI